MRASVVIGRLFVVWRLSAATSLVTSRHSFPDMDPAEFIQSKIYLRNEMEEFVETHFCEIACYMSIAHATGYARPHKGCLVIASDPLGDSIRVDHPILRRPST